MKMKRGKGERREKWPLGPRGRRRARSRREGRKNHAQKGEGEHKTPKKGQKGA